MKKLVFLLWAMILIIFVASDVNALTLVDNFNDGVISGWTTRNGTINESGGVMTGTDASLVTYDSMTGSTIGIDVLGDTDILYVAAVLDYSSLTDNLFVKIQDNNENGLFDSVWFYQGNNTQIPAVDSSYYEFLSFEVAASFFEVTDNGDGTVTASVSATGDSWTKTLSNSYTGTGVGLGFWGEGKADNFYLDTGVSVPEPYTMLLLGTGLLGLAGLGMKKFKKR